MIRKVPSQKESKGNSNAVGEHALGMLLSLLNNINIAEKSISNGKWQRKVFKGTELKSKVIGIIGFGNTGKSFAEKLKGFNSEIIYYDIKKIKSNDKKYLNDAMMTSIAGISAAMKNTG